MTDLVITNYDNFKDLSYFISQHKKASEIMEEVNNFYLSFLKSKLVYNYDIDKFQGKVIVERYREHLGTIEGIQLPPVQKDVQSNFSYFPIE